jgi:hypothetical protein
MPPDEAWRKQEAMDRVADIGTSTGRKHLWRLAAVLFCLALLALACGGAVPEAVVRTQEAEPSEEEPVEEAPPTEAPWPTATAPAATMTAPAAGTELPRPTSTGEALELTADTPVGEADRLGELDLDYPVRMSPNSSDIVRLSIQIPDRLVSLEPMSVERVVLPPESEAAIGELAQDQATILVAPVMRAELSSPTLGVTAEFPAVQEVAVSQIAVPTFWAWTVAAPAEPGAHILTVKLYLGAEALQPSWLRAYQVEVIPFSPTPAPTAAPVSPTPAATPVPTPTPTLSERIQEGMVENAAEIIISVVSLALSGLIGLAGFAYRGRKKLRARVAELHQQLAHAAGEEEQAELSAAIRDLERARWWQFWKWDD